MNNLPRQKLREIVARYGRPIVHEPRRCEGLLRDYCGAYRREIAVLVSAMEERVAADLLAADTGLPREVLLARLAQRLHDNIAMEHAAAKWAVNSWALALSIISSAELEAMELGQPKRDPTVATTQIAEGEKVRQTTSRSSLIVVSGAGEGDYASLSEALRAAAPGSRLLVRPGLYRESLIIDRPVEIISDGTQEDIIITSASASCVLMRTDEATMRGLTLRQEADSSNGGDGFFAVDISQGRLTLEDCDITSNALSCIGVHNDLTNPLIRRCRIHKSADSGIYIFNAASGTVEDCEIYNNSNVGVAIADRSTPVIRRCTVRDGKHAGIVAWNGGRGLIEECEIFGNARAGVGISEEGDPVIERCQIYGGGNSGVFVHNQGQGTLEDCDIYGHTEPGVAITLGGNLLLRGCRIHDGRTSGVFLREEGKALIERCDIYDNDDVGVDIHAGGVAAIRQCRINRNGKVAIRVKEGGAVDARDCDLTGNQVEAWETEEGALVEGRGNRL